MNRMSEQKFESGARGMGQAKAPRSLRSIATINSVGNKMDRNRGRKISMAVGLRAALFSVSYVALGVLSLTETRAQTAPQQGQAGAPLPAIQITEPEAKRRPSSAPAQ